MDLTEAGHQVQPWAPSSDQHRLAIGTKSKVPFSKIRTPYGRFR